MESRIKPFGCAPVIYALGLISILVCFGDQILGHQDAFASRIGLPLKIILSLLAALFFITPVYIISVLVAKKRIVIHLVVALLAYVILWTTLLLIEQSKPTPLLLEFIARKSITYWLLYCIFFTTLLIAWKLSSFINTPQKEEKNKQS